MKEIYSSRVHTKRIGHPRYDFMANACLKVASAYGINVQRVLDIGSSSGVLLKSIQKESMLPKENLVGVDYGTATKHYLRDHSTFLDHDITSGVLDTGTKFDLINCQEVAEHIDEEFSDLLIETICSNLSDAGAVIFGAAPPGQRGKHHVNLQPLPYWENKFASFKLIRSPHLTDVYREVLEKAGEDRVLNHAHYIHNSMVMIKKQYN